MGWVCGRREGSCRPRADSGRSSRAGDIRGSALLRRFGNSVADLGFVALTLALFALLVLLIRGLERL